MNYDHLPIEMRSAKRWLLWKSVPNLDPTKKARKVPYYASGIARNGELDSAADQAQLARFDEAFQAFQTGAYAGLGFALGPDGTGNYWQGIDLDKMSIHLELLEIARTLPGYTELSPSGDGKHAIGYGRPFTSLGSNASGIEAYSRGRFFTVTANASSGSPCVCLAAYVEQRLRLMHGSKSDAIVPTGSITQDAAASPQTIADLRSALSSMPSDDRGLWVRIGHALKTLDDIGWVLWQEWSATSEKFEPGDATRTWESFKPMHTGYQAVFAEAQHRGWANPQRGLTPAPDSGIFGSGVPHPPYPIPATVDAISVEALERNIVPMSTVVDQANCFMPHFVDMWIPKDEVTLLAGHGGGGKSYVALSIAVHVALGRPFGNLPTTQGDVLFFSAEDGARVLRQRLARICRALNADPLQLAGRLHLLDASDIDPAMYRERREVIHGVQQTVTETPLVDALAQLVKKLDVGLVVVDNASDTFDGDEIKRAAVRAFIRSLRQRIAHPDRAVLLLAHINKDAARNNRSGNSEDYSGSTAWHNSVRSRLSLTPDGDNALKIEHVKTNYGPKAGLLRLEWQDGVPLVAGGFSGASEVAANVIAVEKVRDVQDKAALVMLIQDFDKRGELVNSASQGGFSTYNLIKTHPSYPKNTGSDRLTVLLRELETDGRIYRRTVPTPNRKKKQVFTCVPTPASAPIPDTEAPQTYNAQVEACAI